MREALGQALEAALAQLRPDYSAAIMLRYEEGLAFDEIGIVLGVPEVTARSHVHRARKELAQLLTASGLGAPGYVAQAFRPLKESSWACTLGGVRPLAQGSSVRFAPAELDRRRLQRTATNHVSLLET